MTLYHISCAFSHSVNISFDHSAYTMTDLGIILTFNHLNHLGCCSCHGVVVVVVLIPVLSAVPVADIKAVITGKDCPHMKEKGALKQNKVRFCVCVSVCMCTWMRGRWVCNKGGSICFSVPESCIM